MTPLNIFLAIVVILFTLLRLILAAQMHGKDKPIEKYNFWWILYETFFPFFIAYCFFQAGLHWTR